MRPCHDNEPYWDYHFTGVPAWMLVRWTDQLTAVVESYSKSPQDCNPENFRGTGNSCAPLST
jgi:hypothetical protein